MIFGLTGDGAAGDGFAGADAAMAVSAQHPTATIAKAEAGYLRAQAEWRLRIVGENRFMGNGAINAPFSLPPRSGPDIRSE
jgi:hypothetical protein